MERYAVLAGCSEKSGFVQKSILDIYDFLKSTAGGAWLDREILILPEGVDVQMLKFILRKIAEDGTDFLFLYFCGNRSDVLTEDGFTVGGAEISFNYLVYHRRNIGNASTDVSQKSKNTFFYKIYYRVNLLANGFLRIHRAGKKK